MPAPPRRVPAIDDAVEIVALGVVWSQPDAGGFCVRRASGLITYWGRQTKGLPQDIAPSQARRRSSVYRARHLCASPLAWPLEQCLTAAGFAVRVEPLSRDHVRSEEKRCFGIKAAIIGGVSCYTSAGIE